MYLHGDMFIVLFFLKQLLYLTWHDIIRLIFLGKKCWKKHGFIVATVSGTDDKGAWQVITSPASFPKLKLL